jgi:hypothetical protein
MGRRRVQERSSARRTSVAEIRSIRQLDLPWRAAASVTGAPGTPAPGRRGATAADASEAAARLRSANREAGGPGGSSACTDGQPAPFTKCVRTESPAVQLVITRCDGCGQFLWTHGTGRPRQTCDLPDCQRRRRRLRDQARRAAARAESAPTEKLSTP